MKERAKELIFLKSKKEIMNERKRNMRKIDSKKKNMHKMEIEKKRKRKIFVKWYLICVSWGWIVRVQGIFKNHRSK